MITLYFTAHIEPMGAVRQSRSDTWKPRPAVQRYRVWRDVVRAAYQGARNQVKKVPPKDLVPGEVHVVAYFPIPTSWSKKRQAEAVGKPHRSTIDADNVVKGVMDSIFEEDRQVHYVTCRKKYDDGKGPRLEISLIWDEAEG